MIVYDPTGLAAVAVVLSAPLPLTTLDVSPLTNPLIAAVSARVVLAVELGLGVRRYRQVRLLTVSVPGVKVVKS